MRGRDYLKKYIKIQEIANEKEIYLSTNLHSTIRNILLSLPVRDERLVDQLDRSASSIYQNISKSLCGSIKQAYYSTSVALGSAHETKAWVDYCYKRRFISDREYAKVSRDINYVIEELLQKLEDLRDNGEAESFENYKVTRLDELETYQTTQNLLSKVILYCDGRETDRTHNNERRVLECVSNIAAYIAEGETPYRKRKQNFLNDAYRECITLSTELIVLLKTTKDKERLKELKSLTENLLEILLKEI